MLNNTYVLMGASKESYLGMKPTGDKSHDETDQYQGYKYVEADLERFHIYLLDPSNNYQKVVVTLGENYGMSGSEVTSWAYYKIEKVTEFPFSVTHGIDPTLVEVLEKGYVINNNTLDLAITLNNKLIAWSFEDEDDFSDGGFFFDESLFKIIPLRPNIRKKVFLFTGSFDICMVYLAKQFNPDFKVYNTDTSDILPKDLHTYDVVVLGKKYTYYTFSGIKNILQEHRDVIKVEFSFFLDRREEEHK